MSIITRQIVSNNFSLVKFEDSTSYDKKILDEKIDLWKYVLKYKCDAKEQESILIGVTTLSIDYFAICFAALELAMKIVIIDYNRKDDFSSLEYKDPKTTVLSPIDIFLHDVNDEMFSSTAKAISKFKFFTNCSNRTYNIDKIDFTVTNEQHFQEAKQVQPKSTSVAIRCTSSGTTGTPKIIEHTHEFLYKISKRNSGKFSGDCLHIRNLNHGSSIAVFLLPSLMSDSVTTHLVFNIDEDQPFDNFVDTLLPYRETFEFINFPYSYMIDRFIESSRNKSILWPRLQVQTLSYIQEISKQAIKHNIFKSITSIFGSNETSGPVFECTITKDNTEQDSAYFTKSDDFYNIELGEDGMLSVGMPVYNTNIVTNDIFKLVNGFYIHSGRKDIVKINGEIIDYGTVNEINKKYENLYLVIDSLQNSVYLTFWNTFNEDDLKSVQEFFKSHFNRIVINKISILSKDLFLSGIKIDNELLRAHFRNHV